MTPLSTRIAEALDYAFLIRNNNGTRVESTRKIAAVIDSVLNEQPQDDIVSDSLGNRYLLGNTKDGLFVQQLPALLLCQHCGNPESAHYGIARFCHHSQERKSIKRFTPASTNNPTP